MLQFTIILDLFLDCWYTVAVFCKFLTSNFFWCLCAVFYWVSQSCLTLCDSMDCSAPGPSVSGDAPGKNTEVGCHALLQGIFPTQGLNPRLPHCRQNLYQLSYQESPDVSTVLDFIFKKRKVRVLIVGSIEIYWTFTNSILYTWPSSIVALEIKVISR